MRLDIWGCSPGKDWRFPFKFSENGTDISKRIVGFGRTVTSETAAPNMFVKLV
jgi:hypothetical protein